MLRLSLVRAAEVFSSHPPPTHLHTQFICMWCIRSWLPRPVAASCPVWPVAPPPLAQCPLRLSNDTEILCCNFCVIIVPPGRPGTMGWPDNVDTWILRQHLCTSSSTAPPPLVRRTRLFYLLFPSVFAMHCPVPRAAIKFPPKQRARVELELELELELERRLAKHSISSADNLVNNF